MNCVDIADAALNLYRYKHKHSRWTMVAFTAWLKMAMVNSWRLWQLIHPDTPKSQLTQVCNSQFPIILTSFEQKKFIVELVQQLSPVDAKKFEREAQKIPPTARSPSKSSVTEPISQHHPATLQPIGKCFVCRRHADKFRKVGDIRTSTYCEECMVHVHKACWQKHYFYDQ